MPVTLTDLEERALLYPMRPTLPGYLVVFDTFIQASEARPCLVCGGDVARADRVRARFEVREIPPRASRMFYACGACCLAMAVAGDGDSPEGRAAMAPRLELGQVRPPESEAAHA